MKFDVFLCHNSKEKAEVEKIREQLKKRGIYAWLDKYDFEPFRRWQDQLEEIIPQIKAVAVFIGSSGVGPWADLEMQEFLVEFAERKIRMGLVILPDCPDELIKIVPRFIRSFHWVDFRQSEPDPMEQLIWGITGVKAKREPKPLNEPESNDVELKSERGVDYTQLQKLLEQQKWREADEETARVMLRCAGRESQGWLDVEDINNFPCEDLRTIDQLWLHYSGGKFGFSVQKKIYESLGGTREYNIRVWEKFGARVEWRNSFWWKGYWRLTFNLIEAPQAHLPYLCVLKIVGGWREKDGGIRWINKMNAWDDKIDARMGLATMEKKGMRGFSCLAQRLVICNI